MTSKSHGFSHVPALLNEVLNVFNLSDNQIAFDLTFGFGGHSKFLLESNKDMKLFALDRDPIAYAHAVELRKSHPHLQPLKGKFSQLETLVQENNIPEKSIDFILMDLGSSSMQMDDDIRGFSLSKNAKLDMRMSPDSDNISALEVVNNLGAAQLADIFKKYGEERQSRKVANMIVEYRTLVGPILTTYQLADLILNIIGRNNHDSIGRKAHPATQIFQALRIFVNDELNEICAALTFAKSYLKPISGRCAVISFHSLEDRLVKWAFHEQDFNGVDNVIQRMVGNDRSINEQYEDYFYRWNQDGEIITPSIAEIEMNPRIRSAKMRVGRTVRSTPLFE